MPDKIYLGKSGAKEIETQYGPLMKLDLHVDTLVKFAQEHKTERGYLKLNVARRREVSQHGDTHYIALDTYEPRGGQQRTPPARQQPAPTPASDAGAATSDASSDIPF